MITIIILAEMRSGSHLLGALLDVNGIPYAGEIFHAREHKESFWDNAPDSDYASFVKYTCGHTDDHRSKENGSVCFSILNFQLDTTLDAFGRFAQEMRFFRDCFTNPIFIGTKRRDRVSQAASVIFAKHYDIWHITPEDELSIAMTERQAGPPAFDFDAMDEWVKTDDMSWDFKLTNGDKVLWIDYDDLCYNTAAIMREISRHIGISITNTDQRRYKKLIDPVKDMFIERYNKEIEHRKQRQYDIDEL